MEDNFDLDSFMEGIEEPVEEGYNIEDSIDESPVDNYDFDGDGEEPQEPVDLIDALLQSKGIRNGKIVVLNDNNEEEEIDFNDLSDSEKIDILTQSPVSNNLTDEEINTINYLRQNNTNLVTLVQNIKEAAVRDYLEQNDSVNYTVDQLSDEELFKYDLKEKYPELTEEEVQEELDQASLNEDLFKKKMEFLRKNYKEEENSLMERTRQEEDAKREQAYTDYANATASYAQSINTLHDLELSDTDKNRVLGFLLDRDVNGQPEFFKILNNPEAVFNMAWYHLYGKQAFTMINDYWKAQISNSRKTQQPKVINKKTNTGGTKNTKDYFGLDAYFSGKK